MKNIFTKYSLVLVFLAVGSICYAQNNTYPWPITGNVGIGTNNPDPDLKLHINSNNINAGLKLSINDGGIGANRWVDLGVARFPNAFSSLTEPNDVVMRANPGSGKLLFTNVGSGSTVFATGGFSNEQERMVITYEGNVGIGKLNPTDKLEVNGRVHARAVKIDLNNWSDYVFLSDYNLKPLPLVEAFIKKHGHLENIPSEQDVLENGIDLGEMNRLLLEKVEELTLYTIELNKKITVLESKLK